MPVQRRTYFQNIFATPAKISTWLQRISILVSLDNTIDPSSITPLQGHAQVQMSGPTPVNTNTQLTDLLDYETSYSQTIS